MPKSADEKRDANNIPENERDYYLERLYPAYGNLSPRDIASRAAKQVCDNGLGVGPTGHGVYLDFQQAIERIGSSKVKDLYGNLFSMYGKITGEDPYKAPMRIYPAPHYTMGGLWVDYNLMTTIPGLYAIGEANFSDHGANRLGASALMQGLADGYFVLPQTISHYLATESHEKIDTNIDAFASVENEAEASIERLMAIGGKRSIDSFHRELGYLMWNHCGMSRNKAGLELALKQIPALREEFWQSICVCGNDETLNVSLEKAGRVADFMDLAETMCRDALMREESCGAHFREEHQAADGEAKRNDEDFLHVAAWEYQGEKKAPTLHKEKLDFDQVPLTGRSYK